ncbi:MAG: hypothetical protein ACOYJD_00355 [Christensenellales bacterium]
MSQIAHILSQNLLEYAPDMSSMDGEYEFVFIIKIPPIYLDDVMEKKLLY